MDVFHLDGIGKQRRDFFNSEASDAAAYFGDQEGHFGVLLGEGNELVHVGSDGVHAALHGGYGIALSLKANALSHDGAKPLIGQTRCAATMGSSQIAAKDKDFIRFKVSDEFRCNAFHKVFFEFL